MSEKLPTISADTTAVPPGEEKAPPTPAIMHLIIYRKNQELTLGMKQFAQVFVHAGGMNDGHADERIALFGQKVKAWLLDWLKRVRESLPAEKLAGYLGSDEELLAISDDFYSLRDFAEQQGHFLDVIKTLI